MTLKERARGQKIELRALTFAARDPRVPLYVRILSGIIIAYALSPLDLIPDFIPIIGYADDLILIPLGIWFVLKKIPREVMEDCRRRAESETLDVKSRWIAAGIILTFQILVVLVIIRIIVRSIKSV